MEDKIIDIIIEACGDESIRNKIYEIDLLENDILDSLSFITLIARLEEEFNIELQPTQISPDTWRKADSIIELIKSYM